MGSISFSKNNSVRKYAIFVLLLNVLISNSSDAQNFGRGNSEPDVSMFAPLPAYVDNAKNPISFPKTLLGKRLFFEKNLSLDRNISCNWCHRHGNWGQDSKDTSRGHRNQKGFRNSPTVLNSALNFTQFWDGRTATLEEQATQPILNPFEMAMPSEEAAVARIKSDISYQIMFKLAFPTEANPLTFKNIGNAIAAYERVQMTPSRFDLYLKGYKFALSAKEKDGLRTFINVGCASCHNGPLLGGNSFKKLGIVKPYITDDLGRYFVTEDPDDMYVFKVPMLRNITKTEPYLHDGSIRKLDDMIALMGEYQLGKKLSNEEIRDIITFLKTLEGNPYSF